MTSPGGIAGAMDYKPADAFLLACVACGAEIHGNMKDSPHARASRGRGIIHACSEACLIHPAWLYDDNPDPYRRPE